MCLLWSRLHPVFLAGSVSSAEAPFCMPAYISVYIKRTESRWNTKWNYTPPNKWVFNTNTWNKTRSGISVIMFLFVKSASVLALRCQRRLSNSCKSSNVLHRPFSHSLILKYLKTAFLQQHFVEVELGFSKVFSVSESGCESSPPETSLFFQFA